MSFTEHNSYFSEYLRPRKAAGIEDFIELGLLPDIEGIYRKDYLNHIGRSLKKEKSVDAVFLTHAHMDHIGYIHFLRRDIPIYCSPTTKKIMECRQETGSNSFDEFIEFKKSFHLREKSKGGITRLTKRAENYESVDRVPVVKRPIRKMGDKETKSIGDFDIQGFEVCHSLPGARSYLIETSDARIAYTGDLRLHGYKKEKTERFIEAANRFKPDILISEGTNIDEKKDMTEKDVKEDISDHISNTENLALVNFPVFDLDRMYSIFEASRQNGRKMVLGMKQAKLLKELESSELLEFEELSLSRDEIRIMIPKKGWGLFSHRVKTPDGRWSSFENLDAKESDKEKLVSRDYRGWRKELVHHQNSILPEEIKKEQGIFTVYCDYYRLNNLIDFQPKPDSSFIWSRTQPFTPDMEVDQRRVENWLELYELPMKEAHASGHLFSGELIQMIERINPDILFPIHTEDPEKMGLNSVELVTPQKGKVHKLDQTLNKSERC